MGRTKPSSRKELPSDDGYVGKRTLMEPLPPRMNTPGAYKTIKRARTLRTSASIPRFQYGPHRVLDVDRVQASGGRLAEVRVCASHISTRNDAVRRRLLWGHREYTEDSDVVAMLVHAGFVPFPRARAPAHGFSEMAVTLRIVRNGRVNGAAPFKMRLSNGMRSRPWDACYTGARVCIARAVRRASDGYEEVLAPVHSSPPLSVPRLAALTSAPVLRDAPVISDAAAFDLSNRACLVFALAAVADKGTDRSLCPSRRLSREVLYVETARERFEISRVDPPDRRVDTAEKKREEGKEKKKGLYVRFARVAQHVIDRELFESHLDPLPAQESELVAPIVYKWTALKWDPTGLAVGGAHYDLERVSFRHIPRKEGKEEDGEDAAVK